MDRVNALQMLGLDENASTEDIQVALKAKKQDIAEKKANAPTEALKAKFESLEAKLAEAELALSADSGRSQPAGDSSSRSEQAKQTVPSPLSQTKLADLPGLAPQDAAQVKLQPGQIIASRYEIKELIGQGGMGAVYRAFDKNRDEDIAIKLLLPSLTKNERALERFLNEARVSSKLSHPNIVNVFDVQSEGDMYFLIMELLEGQDLRQVMENQKIVRRPFDIEDVKDYLRQICDGLKYAHETTVHRDIKPENIWVTDEGKVKIMDFGIAQLQSTSQRTQTGAAMGTAYYMAPEQLKGRSNIDGRADQYAVAVLAYELLAEEVPAGVIEPIRELRRDIPSGMANAIMKALSARPENRFDNMEMFKKALFSSASYQNKRFFLSEKKNDSTLISQTKHKWWAAGVIVALLFAIGAFVNLERIMLSQHDVYLIFPENFSDPEKITPDQVKEVFVLDEKYRFISNSYGKYKVIKGEDLGGYEFAIDGMNYSVLLGYKGGKYVVSLSEMKGTYKVLPLNRVDVDWYKDNLVGNRDEFLSLDDLPASDELCQYSYKLDADGGVVNYDPSDPQADTALITQKGDVIVSSDGSYSYASLEYRVAGEDKRFGVDVGEKNIAFPGKFNEWESAYGIYDCESQADGSYRLTEYMQGWLVQKRKSQQAFARELDLDWVEIPGGTFQMGSEKEESEQPVHTVQVPAFQMMSKEVTVGQFRKFVEDTEYLTTAERSGGCYGYDEEMEKYEPLKERNWQNPGFSQDDNHPVVCISWQDAVAFSNWILKSAGTSVALPTEAQWEYAARGGSSDDFHFGNKPSQLCRYGNVSDKTPLPDGRVWTGRANCSDGYFATAPGGRYEQNQYGLYDMHGNAWEWVKDCWNDSYHGAKKSSDARTTGNCSLRILRGGAWINVPFAVRSATRVRNPITHSDYTYGFRLVKD